MQCCKSSGAEIVLQFGRCVHVLRTSQVLIKVRRQLYFKFNILQAKDDASYVLNIWLHAGEPPVERGLYKGCTLCLFVSSV